jgi:RelB antitoxin
LTFVSLGKTGVRTTNVAQRTLTHADNSVVRARIDLRTKREAAAALKKIGLTVSDAFRLLLVRVAAEKARFRSSRSIRTPKPSRP